MDDEAGDAASSIVRRRVTNSTKKEDVRLAVVMFDHASSECACASGSLFTREVVEMKQDARLGESLR